MIEFTCEKEKKKAVKRFLLFKSIETYWYGTEMESLIIDISFIDYVYGHYLLGIHYNLRTVNMHIRDFQQKPYYKDSLLIRRFELVEQELLENEMYELLVRHKKAKKRIIKRFIK